ncbi:unnamed protein product [Didymodactylos carnosus]|uniref:Uncharacterized protein n=1 Tax=Didymodactylos carnosus TaxID=1234261 RepID=A0A815SQ39_9BILA|nr:unnamed protein product [Didymodactylos carnosus]CAF1492986.1 unnamed protein product [Didymodactylos carnosus]CAF4232737.1 unnamed protein product [Didymodactylos carnosus]CAF4355782.1 unnamed protein product [Didymodactylos carnosus]
MDEEWHRSFRLVGLSGIYYDSNVWNIALATHNRIYKQILSHKFIQQRGIYRITRIRLWEWLIAAAKSNILTKHIELAKHGCTM